MTTGQPVLYAATDPVTFTNTSTGPGMLSYQWAFGDEGSMLRVKSAFFSKNYAAAIGPGERLVSTDEPATQALTWLALSYCDLKLYPECIHACDHILDIGLQSEQVYYYEAGSYAKMKQYATSDLLLHICLKIAVSPTAEWYYDQLGSNHEALKEYGAAEMGEEVRGRARASYAGGGGRPAKREGVDYRVR